MKTCICLLPLTFTLYVVMAPLTAQAQNVEYVGSIQREGVEDVMVMGTHAYCATDSGLLIVDVSNPSQPNFVSQINLSGGSDIDIRDIYAYLANAGLQIIDIANPASPSLIGSYNSPGSTVGVFVADNYAYLADFEGGLEIVDISIPNNPSLTGSYDTSGRSNGVSVSGNYAYLADYWAGLEIIDISNPANPSLTANYDTLGWPLGILTFGNHAFLADGGSGMQIVDISNPASPSYVSWYDTPGYAWDVFVSGNYAYVGDQNSGLQIIDISDLANPSLAGSYYLGGAAANGVYVYGDYIYVAAYHSLTILHFTSVDIIDDGRLPDNFSLSQNYPNPFNAQTTIKYSLPKQSLVTIDIFDILGRKIETLAEGIKPAGNHQAVWDASGQASGIYFYRTKAGDNVETKKMVLLK